MSTTQDERFSGPVLPPGRDAKIVSRLAHSAEPPNVERGWHPYPGREGFERWFDGRRFTRTRPVSADQAEQRSAITNWPLTAIKRDSFRWSRVLWVVMTCYAVIVAGFSVFLVLKAFALWSTAGSDALSPRVPNLVPIPGPRMERETPGQRPRPNYGHPQALRCSLMRSFERPLRTASRASNVRNR